VSVGGISDGGAVGSAGIGAGAVSAGAGGVTTDVSSFFVQPAAANSMADTASKAKARMFYPPEIPMASESLLKWSAPQMVPMP
jgi:hypothetical protein